MADLIIPATETPGAKDVRVNEFIDHIVADWFTDEERAGFLAGLDEVDVRTQNLFQKTFVDASLAAAIGDSSLPWRRNGRSSSGFGQ